MSLALRVVWRERAGYGNIGWAFRGWFRLPLHVRESREDWRCVSTNVAPFLLHASTYAQPIMSRHENRTRTVRLDLNVSQTLRHA